MPSLLGSLRGRTVPTRTALATCLLVVALAAGGCGGGAPEEQAGGDPAPELEMVPTDGTFDHEFVIPFGTAELIDSGETVEIVPPVLDVVVGERIRIVNEDVRGANVGIFWVPAERTVTMEFTTPGTLTGECDVHPEGTFTVNVAEA